MKTTKPPQKRRGLSTSLPTTFFALKRLRIDIRDRLKKQAKVRNTTMEDLANTILDSGLKLMEDGLEQRIFQEEY